MKIKMPHDILDKFVSSLKKAGKNEIGGILMGEHISENEFRIVDITVQRLYGTIASFTRLVDNFIQPLKSFFKRTSFVYSKFNYLGEWHSHPSYEPVPSNKDILSMLQIVQDKDVGANFAVLIIVKLDNLGKLILSGTVYFPTGSIKQAFIEAE